MFLVPLGLKRWFVFELFHKRVIATDFIAGSVVPCVKNDELRGLFERLTLSNCDFNVKCKVEELIFEMYKS